MFIRESIREHFQKLHQRIKYAALAVFLVVAAAVSLTLPGGGARAMVAGVVAGIVCALIVTMYMRSRFRCPSCKTDLLKLQKQQGEQRMFWEVWEKCPHCGNNLNDIWPP